jgi:hypothetical protein
MPYLKEGGRAAEVLRGRCGMRGGRRRFALGLSLLALAACGGAVASWHLSPGVRELVWIAGLVSGVDAIQQESARALRDYPSNRSALSLLAFVNLTFQPDLDASPWREAAAHPERVSDEELARQLERLIAWSCLEGDPRAPDLARYRGFDAEHRRALLGCAESAIAALNEDRERDRKLAEEGVSSLCLLTGHAFGSYFEGDRRSYTWGSLSNERWPRVLGELDGWAVQTFGDDALAELRRSDPWIAAVLPEPL